MSIQGPIMQPLGRFFLIEAQSKDGSYLMECDDLPRGKDNTLEDALYLLQSFDDAIAVYEVCEGRFTDVSREIAEAWLAKLMDTHDPEAEDWPAFLQRHLSPLKLEEAEAEILSALISHRNHVRSYARLA